MSDAEVYVASDRQDTHLAEVLASRLASSRYEISHNGTVEVGDSVFEHAVRCLRQGMPVVLCATSLAVGKQWLHRITNAARDLGNCPVFVVKMDHEAYVDQLSAGTVVAEYWRDPDGESCKLRGKLEQHFPDLDEIPNVIQASDHEVDGMDLVTNNRVYDAAKLKKFRDGLRQDVAVRFPADLPDDAFLQRAGVMTGKFLTVGGSLLFGVEPAVGFPWSVTQCTRFFGLTRSASRDPVGVSGTIPEQMEAIHQYVATHSYLGEAPSSEGARAEPRYAYPMIAVREIIANALVHRDYSMRHENVHVRLFADRLEIASPGVWASADGEPSGTDLPLVLYRGESHKRNFRLAQILGWNRLFEGEGTGIGVTLEECTRASSSAPTVRVTDGFVVVTLFPIQRDAENSKRRARTQFQGEVRLARALRELRDSRWPDARLTQSQLAMAFSSERRVTAATISSWESRTNPRIPTAASLNAYARFFATRRSLTGGPHLIPEHELTLAEQEQFREIQDQLLDLIRAREVIVRGPLSFDDGPVTVVCSNVPASTRGHLEERGNRDFAALHQYRDLDSLLEIYGHLRATNPTLDVFHRVSSDVYADDLSAHVILLGGIAWNRVTRRFADVIRQVPITHIEDPQNEDKDAFAVGDGQGQQMYSAAWEFDGGSKELVEDVACIIQIPNPFNSRRTLTICNGLSSRGVLGAVRCLTDVRVRDDNETYLAKRFPDARFALLVRVSVLSGNTLSPDLRNLNVRLYEWPSLDEGNE